MFFKQLRTSVYFQNPSLKNPNLDACFDEFEDKIDMSPLRFEERVVRPSLEDKLEGMVLLRYEFIRVTLRFLQLEVLQFIQNKIP